MYKKISLYILITLIISCSSSWRSFTSAGGRFSVLLPDIPKEEDIVVQTDFGPVAMHIFSIINLRRAVSYTIIYGDYPAQITSAAPEVILEQEVKQILSDVSQDKARQKDIMISGKAGKEVIMHNDNGETIYVRLCVVKNTLYKILATVSDEKKHRKDIDTFLNSFRIQP
ncbi:hypothetical protein ACFL6D_04485 [Spirochaetota bacterium]